ncbi:ETS-related transcription factor Elf-3 [Lamellibrachia satsuma]|nr:ETS-related transcription factor Elf-3 [Lamellibrachia satsuma]
MNCSPFHTMSSELPDTDDSFLEQFYVEDSKSCLELLGAGSASSGQVKEEFKEYTPLVPAIRCIDTDKSSPLMSDSVNNRFFCPDEIDLKSWTNKHPEQWGPREVLDWVYYVADMCHITGIRGEVFNRKTGSELCRFTREQFLSLEPTYGGLLHGCLHLLLRKSKFQPPVHLSVTTPAPVEKMECETSWTSLTMASTTLNSVAPSQPGAAVKMNGTLYDFDLKDPFNEIEDESGYSTGESATDYEYMSQCVGHTYGDIDYLKLPSIELLEEAVEQKPRKRSPGRPRKRRYDSDSSSEGDISISFPPGRKPGHVSKGNHLWEFVRDLLANPMYNPSLVRWEDEANGVFRFVQSEKVARLWGEKKNNKSMTYEKLSRAMRFCRSAGYFADIPKTERFPKKLCFKFGPKALKWRGVV